MAIDLRKETAVPLRSVRKLPMLPPRRHNSRLNIRVPARRIT